MFCSIQLKKSSWGGQPSYDVLINDSTEHTQNKINKHKGTEQKQQKDQAESFKATASHELRTPIKMSIQMITSVIETYLRPFENDPKVQSMIKLLSLVLSQL